MKSIVLAFLLVTLFAITVQSKKITVPGQASSIQAAIDMAGDGDTVFVHNGIWREHVNLREGVALTGESMKETVIKGKKRSRPVIKAVNNSLIKNLTVCCGRTGILCENVDLTIEQVIVRNNNETGIHCLIALPNICNSIIMRNRWSGIYCESARSIKTSIMHNIIAENGYSGITLEGQSEVLIQNNVFIGNRQFGIWGSEGSRRTRIIYNDFFDNRSTVNTYLTKDVSNISDDPEYPRVSDQYDFFSTSGIALKGRGKDGATIGLISNDVLTRKVTDPDGDGIGLDDKCPGMAEDIDGFEDDDGCPEFDNDNDGIYDTEDGCPNSAEDYDGYRDDDGCDDFDNDNDGIPDSIDICKGNPETVNGYKDDDGCPDEIPPDATITPVVPQTEKKAIAPPAAAPLQEQKTTAGPEMTR